MKNTNHTNPTDDVKIKPDETKGQQPFLFVVYLSASPEAASAIGDYITVRGKMKTCGNLGNADPTGLEGENRNQQDRYLQDGIARSTHVLGLVSAEDPEPWWLNRVLEVGKATDVELALLTLKGVTDEAASYDSFEVLRGIKSLNEYLFRVSPEVDRIIFNNPEYGGLMAHTAPNHPLDAYLDWEK